MTLTYTYDSRTRTAIVNALEAAQELIEQGARGVWLYGDAERKVNAALEAIDRAEAHDAE